MYFDTFRANLVKELTRHLVLMSSSSCDSKSQLLTRSLFGPRIAFAKSGAGALAFTMEGEQSVNEDLAPFDLLPDELVLVIIKMAVENVKRERSYPGMSNEADENYVTHNYLIHIIGNVSTRFNRLAADQLFWKGRVNINLLGPTVVKKLKMVIHAFLGAGVDKLILHGGAVGPKVFISVKT